MIDKEERLPVSRQCELADLPRSSAYYKPVGADAKELELMREIDRIYTEFPFFGTRQMRREPAPKTGRHLALKILGEKR